MRLKGSAIAACLLVVACGGQGSDPIGPDGVEPVGARGSDFLSSDDSRSTIWDLFQNSDDPNVTLEVNRYIWIASQEVLNFMPIEAADPFTGVLVLGYGVPPGGRQSYRATVYVQDPALDARSLNLSLQTRSGPAAPDTVRAIEDAILTRARQLRMADQRR